MLHFQFCACNGRLIARPRIASGAGVADCINQCCNVDAVLAVAAPVLDCHVPHALCERSHKSVLHFQLNTVLAVAALELDHCMPQALGVRTLIHPCCIFTAALAVAAPLLGHLTPQVLGVRAHIELCCIFDAASAVNAPVLGRRTPQVQYERSN